MVIVELIYNLSVLAACSIISGFIDVHYDRKLLSGRILQGLLFGLIAIIGMLSPFVLEKGGNPGNSGAPANPGVPGGQGPSRGTGSLRLEVADGGVGLPADYDIATAKTFGTMIVTSLVSQINETIEFSRENGTVFAISFPEHGGTER